MASTSSAERPVRFQLAVPVKLANELAVLPNLDSSVEALSDRKQAELAIETVAAIVSIVVAAKDLTPTIKLIAKKLHEFFARSGSSEIKVVGRNDQRTMYIDLDGDADATANEIRIVVTR
jgi:hypothetical protein